MAILTLAELRQHLAQVPAGATYDAKLQDAVDRANDIVERAALPVVFAAYPATATQRVVYSDGTSVLYLPPYEADTLVDIRYGSATASVTEATTYRVSDDNPQYLH